MLVLLLLLHLLQVQRRCSRHNMATPSCLRPSMLLVLLLGCTLLLLLACEVVCCCGLLVLQVDAVKAVHLQQQP